MPFNIKLDEQSLELESGFKSFLFEHVHSASQETNWMRISGIGVGAVSALATVAGRIALALEDIIKGIGNMAGAMVGVDNCSFSKGLKLIALKLPLDLIIGIGIILIQPLLIIRTSFSMLFTPEQHSYNEWCHYDFKAHEKLLFKKTKQLLKKNPEKEEYIFRVANCYEKGEGTEKNEKLAFEMHSILARKKPSEIVMRSRKILANMYLEGIGTDKNLTNAYVWFHACALENDFESILWVAKYKDEKVPKKKAAYWYEKAAHFQHKPSMIRLGELLEETDIDLAAHWYEKAGEEGNNHLDKVKIIIAKEKSGEAMFERAIQYDQQGIKEEANFKGAIYWYSLAADRFFPNAALRAGEILETGYGAGEGINYKLALNFYQRAGEAGKERYEKLKTKLAFIN